MSDMGCQMSEMDTLLTQGVAAAQAGDLQRARSLFEALLEKDPHNEEAWLWLSAITDDVEERKAYLRRVLELDYDNEKAWRQFNALTLSPPKPEEVSPIHTEARDFTCPGCGSDVRYDPRQGTLACPHCGQMQDIPRDTGSPESMPLGRISTTRAAQEEWIGRRTYHCQDCGATTTISARQGSLQCPFCGSTFVLEPQPNVPLITPQAILPFRLDEQEAEEALRHWLSSDRLWPDDLGRQVTIERLRGVYIPFWIFDGLARFRRRDPDNAGHLSSCVYANMPVCGSLSLKEEMAQGIEPFDLEALKRYRPEYTAGWPVEIYQTTLAEASIQARARVREDIEDRYGPTDFVHFTDVYWKLALLPVYLGTYRYRNKLYLFAVNGQTGKVFAQAPRDPIWITLIAITGVFLIALVAILVLTSAHLMR